MSRPRRSGNTAPLIGLVVLAAGLGGLLLNGLAMLAGRLAIVAGVTRLVG